MEAYAKAITSKHCPVSKYLHAAVAENVCSVLIREVDADMVRSAVLWSRQVDDIELASGCSSDGTSDEKESQAASAEHVLPPTAIATSQPPTTELAQQQATELAQQQAAELVQLQATELVQLQASGSVAVLAGSAMTPVAKRTKIRRSASAESGIGRPRKEVRARRERTVSQRDRFLDASWEVFEALMSTELAVLRPEEVERRYVQVQQSLLSWVRGLV